MIRKLLLAICLCCVMNTLAQNSEEHRWHPELGLEFTTEQQVTQQGKYNFANQLRLSASLPIGKRLSLDIASLSFFMTSKESIGGDLQTFSNLDADNIPLALSMCGLNWDINDSHMVFAGLRNMNEDYFISPVTSLFTNSSCGIFPTLSANYEIANYPLASMGVHYKYEYENENYGGNGKFTIQASLYNGLGYRNFAGHDNILRFCPKDDGLFALTQIDYQYKGGRYFLGVCGRKPFGNIFNDVEGKGEAGATMWTYTEQDVTSNLSLMAAYSHAFGKNPECTDFAGLGGKYSWKKSELGVFSDYARYSGANECATELTFKAAITPHINIQPSAHFIVTHITGNEPENAFHFAATLRVGVSL